MKRHILILFLILAILTVPLWTITTLALTPTPAGNSLFAEQCPDILTAEFTDWSQDGAGWTLSQLTAAPSTDASYAVLDEV